MAGSPAALPSRKPLSLWSPEILTLCLVNLNESFAVNVIWPFLPFAIRDWHTKPDEVGFYAGIFASVFFGSQLITAGIWGWFSDRYGRRPTLLLGLVGSAIAMTLMAFGQTYATATAFRAIAGALNGNIGATKVMVSELLPREVQPRAMALLSFNWGLGSVIAPIVGGFATRNVLRDSYGVQSEFLDAFPYVLPCLSATVISLLGLTMGLCFLPESPVWLDTHKQTPCCDCVSRSGGRQYSRVIDAELELSGLPSEASEPTSLAQEEDTSILVPIDEDAAKADVAGEGETPVARAAAAANCTVPATGARIQQRFCGMELDSNSLFSNVVLLRAIGLYGSLAMATTLIDELFPVIVQLPVELGGLALHEQQIGQFLVLQGVYLIVFQLTTFHRLVDAFGERPLIRFGAAALTVIFAFLPFVIDLAGSGDGVVMWLVMGVLLLFKTTCLGMCFSLTFVAINSAAKGHRLGLVNGVSQSMASAVRALGPTLGGLVLSSSLHLPWRWMRIGLVSLLMSLLMLVSWINSSTMPAWVFGNKGGEDPGAEGSTGAATAPIAAIKERKDGVVTLADVRVVPEAAA